MIICIVGVTGLVGKKIALLLEKRKFNINRFIPVASEESYGKIFKFYNNDYKIQTLETLEKSEIFTAENSMNTIVFFASSTEISQIWVPRLLKYNKSNIKIIDNSSFFRLNKTIPLIIPEINSQEINNETRLIANPNCSTAQLVMVLYPLHIKYKVKRVIVSTYQSVSGAGNAGINQLNAERNNAINTEPTVFNGKIDLNCIPLCDKLDPITKYTKEEIKLQLETPKILNANINITATSVRVPVIGGHSESVNIEFYNDFNLDDVTNILNEFPGVTVKNCACPAEVFNETDIWVSRIRRDSTQKNSLNLWIVADNLMKGAALNAVQIAEHIQLSNKF